MVPTLIARLKKVVPELFDGKATLPVQMVDLFRTHRHDEDRIIHIQSHQATALQIVRQYIDPNIDSRKFSGWARFWTRIPNTLHCKASALLEQIAEIKAQLDE